MLKHDLDVRLIKVSNSAVYSPWVLNPAIAVVVVTIWRAVHPFAITVIIAGGRRRIDARRMPAVVLIVISKGVAAIGIWLSDLVPDNSANDRANDRAKRLVTMTGNDIAGNTANGSAANRCNHAVRTLAFAGLLGECADWD